MDLNIDDYIARARQNYQGNLFVISGPSGVGKGTLVKEVLPLFQNLTLSVSMTTRSPRPGEIHGVNYFFVSRDEFVSQSEKEAFLEFATYNGNHYGTPRTFVYEQLRAGRDVILEIDVQGAAQVRANWGERTILVFILPPSEAALQERLEQRRTESPEIIAQRLAQVAKEVAELPDYDYFVINDQLATATEDLAAIIRAERHKIRPIA